MEGKVYKNKVRLDNPRAVQRLLARTINGLMDSDIEVTNAKAIGYLCNILLNSFETIDLEERLLKLEEQLQQKTS